MCIKCATNDLHIQFQNSKKTMAKELGHNVDEKQLDAAGYIAMAKDIEQILPEAINRVQNDPEFAKLTTALIFHAERSALLYSLEQFKEVTTKTLDGILNIVDEMKATTKSDPLTTYDATAKHYS